MEQEALIINETTLTEELHFEFNKILFNNTRILLILLPLLLVYLSLYNYLTNDITSGTVFIILAIVLPIIILYLRKAKVKKLYKSFKLMHCMPVNTYHFFDDHFEIFSHSLKSDSRTSLKYSDLYKITISNNLFLLNINIQQAYIIRKDCFIKGNSDELSILLFKNFPKIKLINK